MANGAEKLFGIIAKTNNTDPSMDLVQLNVISIDPITFKLGDKLIITKEFYIFKENFPYDELAVGDKVTALKVNGDQLYYIVSSEGILPGYTKEEINTILEDYPKSSDLATVATSGSYDDLTDKPAIGNLTDLITTDKTTLVNAINEVCNMATIDQGSNANGKYFKFSSGLMICTKEVNITCKIDQAWGNLYYSGEQSLGNYAAEFISTPTITATSHTSGYSCWVAWVRSSTTTSFGTCELMRPNTVTTSQTYPIHLTAIGYWKTSSSGGGGSSGGSTPTGLATVAYTGDYYDLVDLPVFADVATSGSYNDLTDTPTIDSALSSSSENAVQNKVINTALGNKAPLASPALTGTPTAPTAAAGTNTTQISTTAFVKTAIDNALAGITGVSFQVVNSLPATGENGVIYLISNSGTSPNIYDEYIWVNNAFEKIGTTEVDLSNYVQTTDLIAITNAEIDTICV